MRARDLVMAAVVLSLAVFSGCVSDADRLEDAPSPQATETTGGIDGTVTDDEFMPLAEAEVHVLPGDRATTTDRQGKFVFNDLAPGAYTIAVLKLGYFQRAVQAPVLAGQITEIEIPLEPVPISEPDFTETFVWDGMLFVGTAGGSEGGIVGPPVDTVDFTLTINGTKPDGTTLAATSAVIDLATVESPNAIDLDLFLLDPEGNAIDSSASGAPDEIIEYHDLMMPGDYTVRVIFWAGVVCEFTVTVTVTYAQGEMAQYAIDHA